MSGVTFFYSLTFAADAFTLISETILCVENLYKMVTIYFNLFITFPLHVICCSTCYYYMLFRPNSNVLVCN